MLNDFLFYLRFKYNVWQMQEIFRDAYAANKLCNVICKIDAVIISKVERAFFIPRFSQVKDVI